MDKMAAESKRKEYMQRWENYKSQKLKEKTESVQKTKCTSSESKVTRFSGVTKLRRQTLASFENKKHMESRSRLSLAPYLQPRTSLKNLNSDRKNTKTTKNLKTVSSPELKLPKENKLNNRNSGKFVPASKFKDVPSRTDSNLRRKTLDPNFKKSLPKEKPVTGPIIYKSPDAIKKEVPIQNELKTLLISTNLGTPNTLKIPSISNKPKILQESYQNEENVKKFKQRSVKFTTPEHSSKPYAHSNNVDERREKMNEWLRKRGKAPVTNRHSLCFCKQIPDHEGPLCKSRLTKEEIMMQKKKLDDEKHKVPKCNEENLEKCEVKEDIDVTQLPKMEISEELPEQLDPAIQECSILLDAGCPTSNILRWLKEIEERLPAAIKSAEFWLLKARVHAIDKDMDCLLESFSNAMKHGATPINIIADSMPQMIKDVIASDKISFPEEMPISEEENELVDLDEMNDDDPNYSPSQSPVGMDSIFDYDVDDLNYETPVPPATPGIMRHTESSIKYLVQKTTPFKKRSENHDDSAVIVTPVRRSNRKSMGRKSPSEIVINSLDELSLSDKKKLLLKSNAALENK